MVLSESRDDELYKIHVDLCAKLNLDSNIVSTSWETFESIKKKCILEGDKLQWLGCSIYVASREVETPTVDTSGVVKGMGINLTTLLRYSNLSFSQFFTNITRWAEMAQLPDDFRNKVSNLRSKFSIAYNTFKKFHKLFTEIFVSPVPNSIDMEASKHRNRKNRSIPCTSFKIFEFIWNLYITLKAEEPSCSTELIKSHHLLYCCIDLAFKNIVASERRDLLNTAVTEELLTHSIDNRALSEVPCLIKHFCNDSVMKDALHMKVYTFKQLVNKSIDNGMLLADDGDFTGIFDQENFDQNFRNVTKTYETYLLSQGDFDERIFLAEHKRLISEKELISTFSMKNLPRCDSGEASIPESPRNSSGPVTPGTPLTGRKYLGPRESNTDISSTDKVPKLQALITDRSPAPSENLTRLFESFEKNPAEKIESVISRIRDKFVEGYLTVHVSKEDAQSKFDFAVTLFYKYIELIINRERNISADIAMVIEKDIFYECTLAGCLEMVLYCHNFAKPFPWILKVLKIEAIQFVKIIELIVRCKDNLFRDLIKHLNRIEETVIESLAWASDSPIWQAIEKSGQPIPKFEDIALPGQLLYNDISNDQEPLSPGVVSATDCFQSPMNQIAKNLFPSGGQSILQKPTHFFLPGRDGNVKVIQLVDTEKKPIDQNSSPEARPDPQAASLPRRTGSIAIIFRKFYNLASMRMELLYSKLRFTDFDLKRKMWTIFEDSIRHTDLIKDRHLDQLLMCAIYVISKACNVNRIPNLFSLIMKHYRDQPQASSAVYRDVLIEKETNNDPHIEKRGDLINFYNTVYVNVMQEYAIRFQPNNANNNIILSPLPASRKHLNSPNMQVLGNVFVRPLDIVTPPASTSFSYNFSRSPSKDLQIINRAINNNGVQGKRLLTDDDNETTPSNKRISNRKIQSLVEDRLRQNTE
ncbi:retinoblastoma-like protein 1 [Sitophilus oryzae]|uniref:Retinoblastoma-like protein 1 n=1 Tax=Sitophilus oryzae TaxID=7048 RepID=A0A6J2Y006_SITOR|nr:retinoblastoma-like protein 1 [Sitophilus oryzae]